MIVLTAEQLPALLHSLSFEFPQSLNIYHLVKHKLAGAEHEWSGTEFVVDQWPEFHACLCRSSGDMDTAQPSPTGYGICIFARTSDALRQLLDEKEAVDWSRCIAFHSVRVPDLYQVLEEKVRAVGGRLTHPDACSDFFGVGKFVGFDLRNLPEYRYTLPQDYTLGSLTTDHIDQLTVEKQYGDNSRPFFAYILTHGFPSSAVFDGVSGRPVSYLLQRTEGTLGAGYTHPQHRGRGLYKIVFYELLRTLQQRGDTFAYSDISPTNDISRKGMVAVGGRMYEDYDCTWMHYQPASN